MGSGRVLPCRRPALPVDRLRVALVKEEWLLDVRSIEDIEDVYKLLFRPTALQINGTSRTLFARKQYRNFEP